MRRVSSGCRRHLWQRAGNKGANPARGYRLQEESLSIRGWKCGELRGACERRVTISTSEREDMDLPAPTKPRCEYPAKSLSGFPVRLGDRLRGIIIPVGRPPQRILLLRGSFFRGGEDNHFDALSCREW
jgi:hypothetical protein